uniref:Glutathione synthetase n=1 Tax=Panagrellus redivivus TaxID=6233 RepID=A0A7E4ZSA1_PANRE
MLFRALPPFRTLCQAARLGSSSKSSRPTLPFRAAKMSNFNPDDLEFVPNFLLPGHPVEDYVEEALDWAHCHGLAMRTTDHKDRSDVCAVAPMALFPSPFPRKLYDQAMEVQGDMMTLYHRISWSHDFLIEAHKEVVKTDEFTRKLVEIYETVWAAGVPQKKIVMTQRADYMANVSEKPEGELRQIEVNNIAVSMGGLAQRVSLWHHKVIAESRGLEVAEKQVPRNEPVVVLASALENAWRSYGDLNAAILVVVEDVNQNQLDQRFIEYELIKAQSGPIPKIVRATLTQVAKLARINENDNTLTYGPHKIGLVYFRSGYSPANYPSEAEWKARETIELSNAIKCPWIGLQLANTKKAQQVLAAPGAVEQFFNLPNSPTKETESPARVRATFARMWGLEPGTDETNEIIAAAIANPELYVLKPQLEGGGGNFYGEEMAAMLGKMKAEELSAFILMERIRPMSVKNVLVRAFQPASLSNVVGELGIYGTLLGEGPLIHSISVSGHIIRSKAEGVNEGGVAVGAAVIDSAFLI